MLAVIVAPVLETIVFQYGIIETMRNKFSAYICCFISALLFAVSHLYNPFYFIVTFLIGLLFGYLYYIGGTIKKGIFLTMITHVLYNLTIFTLKNLFS
jgi:membrane protease YdiL (CAAX protease family)